MKSKVKVLCLCSTILLGAFETEARAENEESALVEAEHTAEIAGNEIKNKNEIASETEKPETEPVLVSDSPDTEKIASETEKLASITDSIPTASETSEIENNKEAESAEEPAEEPEPVEPPLFKEPFAETDLSFLPKNFEDLNKNYTFNYFTSELKLAFLSLNSKLDNRNKRYEYKLIVSDRLAPYKITSCLGIFPEFAKIAELIRLKIVKKASEQIVKRNIEKALKETEKAFKIIDEIQNNIYQSIKANEQCVLKIENSYLELKKNKTSPQRVTEPFSYLLEQCQELSDVYEAYKKHSEYCGIYLNYAINEPSSIRQAVSYSNITKDTKDFMSYYDYYRDKFLEYCNTSRSSQPRLYIERDALIKRATDSINQKLKVTDKLYKFPNNLKSPDPDLSMLLGKETLKKIFELLNELCDSDLLKDELTTEENQENIRKQRLDRSEKLLEALLPYLDQNQAELTPDYGLLFREKEQEAKEDEEKNEEDEEMVSEKSDKESDKEQNNEN